MAKSNMLTMSSAALLQVIRVFLYFVPILVAALTLSYLGYKFADDLPDIETDDWRRKWLIFFSWLTVAVMIVNIILGNTSLSLSFQPKYK